MPDLAPTDEARAVMKKRLRNGDGDDDVSTHGTIGAIH